MKIVTEEGEIEKYQQKFIEGLKQRASSSLQITVAHHGGRGLVNAYFSKELGIWFATAKSGDKRYWNVFGLGEPSLKYPNAIVVEINFPIRGIDRRVGGVFVREDDKVLVCHRGRIGGGRQGIGLKGFWENFQGASTEIDGEKLAVIGYLDSYTLPENVKDFILEVNRIKNLLIEGEEDATDILEEAEKENEVALTLERDLKNYLKNNLEMLEKGLRILDTEHATEVGRIDILAEDKESNLVVIELKTGVADINAFSQIASYMGSLQKELGKKKIRGIIVASDFDEKIKLATLTHSAIVLKKI